MARYARAGVEVHLVCATGGEEGSVDAKYLEGHASVAELRRAELECAARVLGLASVTMLGYRDSGMPGAASNEHPEALAAQKRDAVTARVCAEIRRLRPQVVVTFDPIGGYRHPDHIAIHEATVAAFRAAGDGTQYPGEHSAYTPQKLYYMTFGRALLRLSVALMPLFRQDPRRFGRNKDIDLASLAEVDFPTHARVDVRSALGARADAGACHASQGGRRSRWAMLLAFLFGAHETYMRAHPEAGPRLRERDLFEGVVL